MLFLYSILNSTQILVTLLNVRRLGEFYNLKVNFLARNFFYSKLTGMLAFFFIIILRLQYNIILFSTKVLLALLFQNG
jgi:hypothetical protein